MKTDLIDEVGIDQKGRLYVRPRDCTFPFIYREGMEVNWDADNGHLYGPPPRTWDYIRWYRQIILAASNQGVVLNHHPETAWSSVPEALRNEIINFDHNA